LERELPQRGRLAGIKFQKRDYDFVISYGYETAGRVAPLASMLKDLCGLSVWFDGDSSSASTRSSDPPSEAIGNARGALFVSEAWESSSWCKDEYDLSLAERRIQDLPVHARHRTGDTLDENRQHNVVQ
jgi:hypothetical protein